MTERTWRRGQKADYTERPLTAEERVFAEEHHEYLYQFMRWNHLPAEEWYEAYVIEKEFLRDLFANVGRYAEPELLEMILDMRIQGYTDTEIARRARLELDDYMDWTLAEIKELIRLLTLGRNRRCAMSQLIEDTKKYGNRDIYDRWEEIRDMLDI